MEDKSDSTETELSRMYHVLSLACCPLLLMAPHPIKETGEKQPLLKNLQPDEKTEDFKSLT